MSRHITLSVNNKPIEIDYFIQGFIDHTTGGMVEALEGTNKIKVLHISIEAGEVKIILNGATVPINTFVNKFIKNTIFGMVSSLKGVSEINQLGIDIERTD